MSYRDDLAALSTRHAALEREVAAKSAELAETAQLLEDARARARLPLIDNVRLASPCSADWTQMTGDDRVRYCGDCQQNVYNLSGMARGEAEALLMILEGRLCVAYYQRADGTIVLADDCRAGERVRRRRRRRRRVVIAGAAAVLAGAAALGWQPGRAAREASRTERTEREEREEIERAMKLHLGKYEGAWRAAGAVGEEAPGDLGEPAPIRFE